MEIKMERVWAMPNKNTFDIIPIKKLLEEVLEGVWIDPFANKNKVATITNDLNPEYETDYNMDAIEFLKMFDDNSVDGVLYDPPYSSRQVSECYKNFGYEVTNKTTNSSYWSQHKKEIEVMEVQGKYNKAKIFTDNIDSVTIGQLINLCNQKEFKDCDIRIMPDCHVGKGCTIGTTMTITNKIVPNLVGVDIGCGMATINLRKYINEIDYKKLDEIIRKYIPHGFNTHDRLRDKLLKQIFKIDLNNIKCDINADRAYKSVGTLGGGNHFIEVDTDSNGSSYLTVHTGSRNLGKQIAEYYQKKAIEYCEIKYKNTVEETILLLKEQGLEEEISEKIKNISKPTDDLCYLENNLMEDYLHDMDIAQKYATANRVVILADILFKYNDLNMNYSHFITDIKYDVIECIHNYIDIENKILRKGAISSNEKETVIIPINMRDGIILGKGKGNPDWNYSAPHGAGRILSRGQAKQNISLEDFEESMKGIFTTCVGQSTLDEAPQAYKPMEDIVNNIRDTVEIIDILKPTYNFKSN